MKKDKGNKAVDILVLILLVISVIGIILKAEDGPVSGAIVVLVTFGFPVLLMVCLAVIMFIANSIRSRRIRTRNEKYLKKYVSSAEYETESFGDIRFSVNSYLNRVYAQFYDSERIVSAEREVSIEIYVGNTELIIRRALGTLEELTENYNEYFEKANYVIAESTDYDGEMLDIYEISIFSEDDGEMYVMLLCDLYTVTFSCIFDDETAVPKIGGNPQVKPY